MSNKPVPLPIALGSVAHEERDRFLYALACWFASGMSDKTRAAVVDDAAAAYVERIERVTGEMA